MTIARETVYAAVFAKLQSLSLSPLITVSRRLRHLQELGDAELPACFQVQSAEDIQHVANMPPVYTFKVEWWLYTFEPDPHSAPSQQLNALLDQLEAALSPDFAGVLTQTLGRQVHRVWVAGPMDIYEGVVLDRAMAIIPIHITVAGS